MAKKPTYEELKQRVRELEEETNRLKRAEKELMDSEERFRYLTESSPLGVFQTDKDGRVLYLNNKWLAITGMSLQDALGFGWAQALHPDDRPQILAKWAKCLEEKRGYDGEFRFVRQFGEIRWVHTRTSPVFSPAGDIISHVGVNEDITERILAEEALRESEDRYKSLFKNNHSVMLLIDPKSGDIVDANPAATSFYGWSYEELTRMKITDINTLTERQVFQEMKRAKTEQRRIFYFKHLLASGKIRDVEVYSGPIKVFGRELLYSIIHDITKRKQAELSLIERGKDLEDKTHELEELNAALNVLLKRREQDKTELEEKVLVNMKELVFPYVEKLNNSRINDRQMVYLNIIKSNLEDIIKPFLHQLSSKYSNLTPSEIQVAGLVKDGKTTKEIAELLNSSTSAIDFHRNNLRKKLGLRNTKTNLRSFLLSLT
jgi:PAS domain S-box-containing protein